MIRTSLFVVAVALSLVAVQANSVRAEKKEKGSAVSAKENRVFELRIYHTFPGRLDALNKRFRDHTCKLFEKHGMTLIGFWTPAEGDEDAGKKLIYLLAFPSREARDKAFDAFRNDPEWIKARDESEKDGKIVEKVESKFLDPTDYSYIK